MGPLTWRCDCTESRNVQVVSGKCWEKVWMSSMQKADSQQGLSKKKG